MDEILARLALRLTSSAESVRLDILSAWNQGIPLLVTRDLREHLAKLIKDTKAELDNKMKAKISWAVQYCINQDFQNED